MPGLIIWAIKNWRVVAIGGAVVATLISGVIIYNNIKEAGRQQERQRVERQNKEAVDAANQIRQERSRLCRDAPDQCLRDEWTRD